MKFTLLQKTHNGNYIWVQDKICETLEEARNFANETEKANSNRIKIFVAEDTPNKGIGQIVYHPKILC